MVIGFKAQFPALILNGTKTHTLRADPKRRWKFGMLMHMATGVRTKHYRCFKHEICTGVQEIRIDWTNAIEPQYPRVYVDGLERHSLFISLLARADGFESVREFLQWFSEDFEGVIIHWAHPYSKCCMLAQ